MSRYLNIQNAIKVTETLMEIREGGAKVLTAAQIKRIIARTMEPAPQHPSISVMMFNNLDLLGIITLKEGENYEITAQKEHLEKLKA